MKIKIILTLIFIFGFLIRIYDLGSIPPGLSWDEVSHGYNAYSILKTGQDEWGQFLPIANFRGYGDYPLTLYMYLSMPFILFFGLNEFSIRLVSALFGSLLILITFGLAKKLTKNETLSLISAFLITISPWSVMTSRQVLQATPAICFMALGVWLFLKGLGNRWQWSLVGLISVGISAYGYHNTRILAPIIILLLFIIFRKVILKQKQILVSFVFVSVVFLLPLIPVILSGSGSARAIWVGILDQGAINHINELRGISFLPDPLSRLIYNKPTYFVSKFILNYLGYFTPNFLAFKGGTQYQFSVPGMGVIYPIELPFFYLGMMLLLLRFKSLEQAKKFLLLWIIVAPIPAAITRDPYQVVRSIALIPGVFIVSTLGLGFFLDSLVSSKMVKLKSIFVISFLLVSVVLFTNYSFHYLFIYPKDYSFAWQYGYKQVASYIQKNQNKYSKIVVTKKYGEPHEFLLFYLKYDPVAYRTDPNLIRYEKSNWFWVDQFSKYQFINDWEIIDKLSSQKNTLLITSPDNYPKTAKFLKTIPFLNGLPAFDIVEL